jgi:hypothetical protein
MNASMNLEVFKEPRGFMKFLQLFMTICAFATTCNFAGEYQFSAECSTGKLPYHVQFSYPFRISDTTTDLMKPPCPNSTLAQTKVVLFGDWSGSSRFYVFVGVMTMLYSLAALALYVFLHSTYETDARIPKLDFIISAGFVIFWFIAAVAWSDGVAKLKEYTGSDRIFDQTGCLGLQICSIDGSGPTYAGLNVSLIFGYANVALWASGLWFLWKETAWFQGHEDQNFAASGAGGLGADGSQM